MIARKGKNLSEFRKELKTQDDSLSAYRILILFIFGCFFGVIIEMFWCLITNGYIESRKGLIYGPFNLLYGMGTVLIIVALFRLRRKNFVILFLTGMLVGSAVEYFCSFALEKAFNAAAWDYSGYFLNINGRICLFYSVIWGFLAILAMKVIYPVLIYAINRIPVKIGKVFVTVMAVFLVFNTAITSFALIRWSDRLKNIPPKNVFEAFLDTHYTDERMQKIFATSTHVK